MSTVRRRRIRRLEQAPKRSRKEVTTALLGAIAVVAFTIVAVWILRPGGIASRQPRLSWLVALALVAVVIIVIYAIRPERTPRQRTVWVPAWLSAVAIIVLVAWFTWPGGIMRG